MNERFQILWQSAKLVFCFGIIVPLLEAKEFWKAIMSRLTAEWETCLDISVISGRTRENDN